MVITALPSLEPERGQQAETARGGEKIVTFDRAAAKLPGFELLK